MASEAKIVIIDTGCANVSSVKFAIERLGYQVSISRQADDILSADKLFLPGVGTAKEAMNNLKQRDLIQLIKRVEKPLLGICLGMQLLGRLSEEKGTQVTEDVECLGISSGDIRILETGGLPLPHMGWNKVVANEGHPLFKGIEKDQYFYFVHSYGMPVSQDTIAQCEYGKPFTAALQKGNFYGVQFHPERSSKAGAQLIQNFLEL
ncbi:imidazole glycerol phosphate synthase subunit HisH [Vibrio sp. S4M6]|uniref:imidazole glycerol phosphate synthase subunit HisH n=1 Tax=Vibrio sinus TaxID=2946865 RepID=UPI00202A515E|nr:imidazole glycerol phosphate synthase subunit HisH [Vibrio sinus]MCL9782351.1 imidazole glycerol phosphate synthase subunit HisH [Vibrio sinus]